VSATRSATAVARLVAGLDVRDDVIEGRHGPIPVRRYRRADRSHTATLVWVHGGAFSYGGLDQRESHAVAAAVAQRAGAVVAVDYRLAPPWLFVSRRKAAAAGGHRFPVPVDDVQDAFAAIAEKADGPVVLGGASAGACLTAAAAVRLQAAGARLPAVLVLAYGTFHAALPPVSPDLRARIRGRHGWAQFRPSTVRRMNENYAAGAVDDPAAFPGGHPLPVLPPTVMLDADRDALRASGEAFAAELVASGTDVRHRVVAESRHGFLDRPGTRSFETGVRIVATAVASAD
jgi:acetyl esterase